jgi:hypothetical protein
MSLERDCNLAPNIALDSIETHTIYCLEYSGRAIAGNGKIIPTWRVPLELPKGEIAGVLIWLRIRYTVCDATGETSKRSDIEPFAIINEEISHVRHIGEGICYKDTWEYAYTRIPELRDLIPKHCMEAIAQV